MSNPTAYPLLDPPSAPSTSAATRLPVPEPSTAPTRWEVPALIALLLGTALLYLWDLGSSGWANSYYSAAAQAMSQDGKAFFFGSLDSANSITVDKTPGSLWVMALSARLFGVNAWSILVPQALMGVASVGVLYAAVRRWFGPAAGILAGVVLALTPVAALMFRFNNPDALMVLTLVLAAWAVTIATEKGSWRWLALAGAFVGVAFLAKMLQAYVVLPAFALTYLVAANTSLGRRVWHLLVALGTTLVASGWWIAIAELWPADSRPYIGGSQDNSVLNLLFGYNGFGRITGDEAGSVVPGGQTPGAGMWGPTGLNRLFTDSYGGQASWLIPAALLLLAVMLAMTLRAPRTDRVRAAAILWGGWLVITGLVISLSAGIIHEYYTVALAPAIGALVGIGSTWLWRSRDRAWACAAMAACTALTAWWAWVLLGRSASFLPWLRPTVLIVGMAAAAGMLGLRWAGRGLAIGVASAALLAALAGPAAYAIDTAATPHSGSLPSAGPMVAGARGGPGGGGPGGPGGQFPGGPPPQGQFPGGSPGGSPGGGPGQGRPGQGGPGGLLNASTPSAELTATLLTNADRYTWVAATVGAQQGAGYQLATGAPVMAIGGFNGSDPSPTLEHFQELVAAGTIHYFIAGGGGPGGPGGGLGGGSAISAWVQQNFASTTVGGVTLYDLTAPAA